MLDVVALRSGYGRIRILDGLNMRVEAGECVGIAGHNGMGKTTLLKTLIGEISTTDGKIVFMGKDVSRRRMYERSRIGLGYVPQGRDIFPQLSVLENLKMGEMARKGESAIPEVLGYFPVLEPLLSRRGGALSGGQQQILALARCLVGRPKLILLDEPTEGIQPSIVDLISERLIFLRKTLGLTIVVVEQKLDFLIGLADRVLIVQKGRAVAEISSVEPEYANVVARHLDL